jgi:hypothetical protein
MKNVILEYASSVIAVFGAISTFVLLGNLYIGNQGLVASLIEMVLGGL